MEKLNCTTHGWREPCVVQFSSSHAASYPRSQRTKLAQEARSEPWRCLRWVQAVVLDKEDMAWAVKHDYRLTDELRLAMRWARNS